ncbi:MAG: hypothetical protein AAB575_04045 [Patescibacteria group bacterium]
MTDSPSIDSSRRIAEWATIKIPGHLINKFLEQWEITFNFRQTPLPENPLAILREMLKDAVLVNDDVYRYRRWFFIIEDNALYDLILTPGITKHARRRLNERLNYFGHELYFLVATEIWAGQPLSKEETKQLWKTAVKDNIRAVRFEKHIYFLTEAFEVVTVFVPGQ